VIQNYPKFRSHQITTKPAPHSPWWSIGPPIFDTKHGTKSPGSQVGMENDERKNPRCHAHKTPKKKESSANHVMICSLRASLWRLEGLASRALGDAFCQHTSEPIAHIYTSGYETKLQWLHDLQDS
jgi:hypothetical protein